MNPFLTVSFKKFKEDRRYDLKKFPCTVGYFNSCDVPLPQEVFTDSLCFEIFIEDGKFFLKSYTDKKVLANLDPFRQDALLPIIPGTIYLLRNSLELVFGTLGTYPAGGCLFVHYNNESWQGEEALFSKTILESPEAMTARLKAEIYNFSTKFFKKLREEDITLDAFCRTLIEQIQSAIKAVDFCCLYARQGTKFKGVLRAFSENRGASKRVIEEALRSKKPLRIQTFVGDEYKTLTENSINTCFTFPILIKDCVVGILYLDSKSDLEEDWFVVVGEFLQGCGGAVIFDLLRTAKKTTAEPEQAKKTRRWWQWKN